MSDRSEQHGSDQSRIRMRQSDEWSDEVREVLGGRAAPFNVLKVACANPDLFVKWLGFGNQVTAESALPFREREIVILRLAVRLGCDYEWGAHNWAVATRGQVLDQSEIDALASPAPSVEWGPREAALIAATDDLTRSHEIGAETWQALRDAGLDDAAMIDLIFLVGNYAATAMLAKSARVPLEAHFARLPAGAAPLRWDRTAEPAAPAKTS